MASSPNAPQSQTNSSVSNKSPLIVISRTSKLALIQTHWVIEQLGKANIQCKISGIETIGDKILDISLAKIGDKGLFTQELENSLLMKTSDLAVHSLKDLPTSLPDNLCLSCVTTRVDPRDAIVLHPKHSHILESLNKSHPSGDISAGDILLKLPNNSVIGTSSIRRQSQISYWLSTQKNAPTVTFANIRGNVQTRLGKLDGSYFKENTNTPFVSYDATILAVAGLVRMGLKDRISGFFESDVSAHAVGQGALGIESNSSSAYIPLIQKTLLDQDSWYRTTAERELMHQLHGGCHTPIGVSTKINSEGILTLTGYLTSPLGDKQIQATVSGPKTNAIELGKKCSDSLNKQGAQDILKICNKLSQADLESKKSTQKLAIDSLNKSVSTESTKT